MTALGAEMTRSSSSDSSALSNILVAAAEVLDDVSEDEGQGPASTPPTSLQDSASDASAVKVALATGGEEDGGRKRARRARSSVGTYNLKKLSDAQEEHAAAASGSRNVSGLTGRTLVDDEEEEAAFDGLVDKAIDVDWEELPAGAEQKGKAPAKVQRRPSVKARVKNVAGRLGAALGKRKRDVVEAGRRTFGKQKEEQTQDDDAEDDAVKKSKWLKELDTGTKGVLDEMDLDQEYDAPPQRPAKRAKTSGKDVVQESTKPLMPTRPTAAPIKTVSGKGRKKWQREGLYVGQQPGFDPLQVGGGRKKLQKKNRPASAGSNEANTIQPALSKTTSLRPASWISLPMFAYLDKTRDFTIPFDVFAPATKKGDEKPKDWHKVNRNRLVGEAKDLWAKVEKLPPSACICPEPAEGETSCEDDCLNRVMQYECNEDNCALPPDQCSNRAFAELAARTKKGGAFDVGVEVLKTDKRGFGVRSCRSFAPGQIIMEYTGEIISEGECQRRMREEYKDKQCYYLMELERGLIIDGTKGSMARFINHSCAPNCEVRMVKVNGTPRMAVFAGDEGVMTGEELTYDYNFDNFGTTQQQCFCGAESCRGFLSKRLNAAEMKKQAREEEAKKRKAAEEAMRAAERESKKRKVQEERGSGWRGWVAVDDPETRERLRQEKKAREEAEKNSTRARRLAARRGSLPAERTATNEAEAKGKVKEEKGKEAKKRRRTMQIHQEVLAPPMPEAGEDREDDDRTSHKRRRSNSATPENDALVSKVKDIENSSSPPPPVKRQDAEDRPVSAHTHTTITRKTEVSIETTTEVLQANADALEDTIAGAEDGSDVIAIPAETDVETPKPKAKKKERGGGLMKSASVKKGKEVMKKAFKGGFSSSSSSSALTGASVGGAGSGSGSGLKFKQTTLSFGRAG